MKAILLCGGLGTRLRPLTYEVPKVLIPIQGKPVIEHIIDLLKRESCSEVVLSTGYLKEKIRDYFGSGEGVGIPISYLEESDPLGTAGPLRLLPPQTEPFLVSNGDEVKDIPLKEMLAQHKETGALATIALTHVDNPRSYGVARLEGKKILEFLEKPQNPPTNLINSGLYIIDPQVISMIPEGFVMLEKSIFPKIAAQGRLFGFPFPGQWYDTGTPERWEQAIKEWKGI